MSYNFDRIVDRRGSDSNKWSKYGADVLPLWVADMDFISPRPILDAIHARVDEGIFGYAVAAGELSEAICERMLRHAKLGHRAGVHRLHSRSGLRPERGRTGHRRPRRRRAGQHAGLPALPQRAGQSGTRSSGRRAILHASTTVICATTSTSTLCATPPTRAVSLFILCNPHNPTGRAYTRGELTQHGRDLRRARPGHLLRRDPLRSAAGRHQAHLHRLAEPGDRSANHHPDRAEQDLQHPGVGMQHGHHPQSGTACAGRSRGGRHRAPCQRAGLPRRPGRLHRSATVG